MTIKVAILGSTGSIGTQTLDVISQHKDLFEVVALAAHSSALKLVEQALKFNVGQVALADAKAGALAVSELGIDRVGIGAEAVVDLIEKTYPDIVINALVGSAGLRATIATLKAGKKLGLANKESLVAGGELVMPLVAPGQMIPVDSEHSAIFQCLRGEDKTEVARLWITASGGPFRGKDRAFLSTVTPEAALAHPTWSMGPKISIDSSTLMNKGLEVIEAHHLFDIGYDEISVVVHPQSCVHSMVEFTDGSVIAHMGVTDMRIPIQFALSYPERLSAPVPPLDMTTLGSLTFEAPDMNTFGCLALALEAGRIGGSMPVVLNAANEAAVAAFLGGKIKFLEIEKAINSALMMIPQERVESLEHLEQIDLRARTLVTDMWGNHWR